MMRTLALVSLAALAALALVPSASAMAWAPPPNPVPDSAVTVTCPTTEEPSHGGVQGAVEQIAYDTTTGGCAAAGIVVDTANSNIATAQGQATEAYDFGVAVVGIVVGAIPVEPLQDATCEFVYGDPNADEEICKDIMLDLSGVTVESYELGPIWV